ncbi:MAG TPA: 2-oxo acid dehydrogenase subunit E2 [Thermodesulfobacteriota bacterium]|nr:2-oxo acid dehydrogenase subunit E2 [Thermodesulfobacteriota bacterium]
MVTEFKLPELGEDIQTGDLLKILVSVGDRVTQDQPIMEIETEKALIEVPAPVGGVVKGIHVSEGEQVKIGQLLITIDEDAEAAEKEEKAETKPKEEVKEEKKEKKKEEKKKEPKVEVKEEREKEKVSAEEKAEEEPEEVREAEEKKEPVEKTVSAEREQGEVVEFTRPTKTAAKAKPSSQQAPASPSVRRLAREIGVDINEVPGSGPGGRISEEDVKNYARQVLASGAPDTRPPGRQVKEDTSATHMISMVESIVIPRLPDFAEWGEIERKPMTNVRRKTAEHVSYGWVSPHVTQHDKADITNLEELRKEYGKKAEEAGGKLTVTAIILKVTASALKVFPEFNTSVDMAGGEIIYKKYYHIGIAVDTDRGLLVPVIRDVDKKNIIELSVELNEISEKARNKKLTIEEMRGGTFTISNLGGIGGTYFTPIINFPEVAILGVSRSSVEPVFIDGQFEPRLMLPLSLSYDHRVIDGADAARFLRWVAEALEQPFKLILEG